MRLKKLHIIGIVSAFIALVIDFVFFFSDKNLFFFILGIALGIGVVPFIIDLVIENKKEQENSEMFLEFSRNLAESVNTGVPVSKSVVNMGRKNYGSLSPYVAKLANQIELGIPVHRALENFAYDVNNPVISRAIALIMEAERAGGEIDYILESVAKSISEVEKLRKERKAAIYSLVVQGYIIFFIFIGIMLVVEFKILPLTVGAGSLNILTAGDLGKISEASIRDLQTSSVLTPEDLSRQFLYLLIVQGFFAGLTIGKLAEGSIKAGLKHSFIMVIAAFLISTGANLFIK